LNLGQIVPNDLA